MSLAPPRAAPDILYGIVHACNQRPRLQSNLTSPFIARVGPALHEIEVGTQYAADSGVEAAMVDTVREGTDLTANLAVDGSLSSAIDAQPISGDGVTLDNQGGFIDWFRTGANISRSDRA